MTERAELDTVDENLETGGLGLDEQLGGLAGGEGPDGGARLGQDHWARPQHRIGGQVRCLMMLYYFYIPSFHQCSY